MNRIIVLCLLFLPLSNSAQNEVFLSWGGAHLEVTVIMTPENSGITTLHIQGVKEVRAFRRHVRRREAVSFERKGAEIQFNTQNWSSAPHQQLEIHYKIPAEAFGEYPLIDPQNRVVLNPAACATCHEIEPQLALQFQWHQLLPMELKKASIHLKFPDGGIWKSNWKLDLVVELKNGKLIGFPAQSLESFFFTWEVPGLKPISDSTLITAIVSENTPAKKNPLPKEDVIKDTATTIVSTKTSTAKDGADSTIAMASVKTIDGANESKGKMEKVDSITHTEKTKLTQISSTKDQNRDSIVLAKNIDEKTRDTTLIAKTSTVKKPSEKDRRAVEFQFDTSNFHSPFLDFWDKETTALVSESKDQATANYKLYRHAKTALGEADTELRLRHLIDRGEFSREELEFLKLVFGDFSTKPHEANVRYNRNQNLVTTSLQGVSPLTVVLNIEGLGDSIIQLNPGTTDQLTTNFPVNYFYPAEQNLPYPLSVKLSDVQAIRLYNSEDGPFFRYWAFSTLLKSSSPHTRATYAAFAMDDEIAIIRTMGLKASLDIPPFAASRLIEHWERLVEEGTVEEAKMAREMLAKVAK
ncbi:MAG: hypothetical protein JJU02_02735 [Cryomorphaceae bacterium]|nr:hypothetical protein [Cryomorphaceae bacterium]